MCNNGELLVTILLNLLVYRRVRQTTRGVAHGDVRRDRNLFNKENVPYEKEGKENDPIGRRKQVSGEETL